MCGQAQNEHMYNYAKTPKVCQEFKLGENVQGISELVC